jgi:hypothetical protein
MNIRRSDRVDRSTSAICMPEQAITWHAYQITIKRDGDRLAASGVSCGV